MRGKAERDNISKRTKTVGGVPSKEMGDIVASLRNRGHEILSLHGSPNWLPSEHVLAAARRAVSERVSQPTNGFLERREAIADTF